MLLIQATEFAAVPFEHLDDYRRLVYDPGMAETDYQERLAIQQLDRKSLESLQLDRLNRLLEIILPANRFYDLRCGSKFRRLAALNQLDQFPFTLKEDLLDGAGGFPANLTWTPDMYSRLHRTSGTRGRPMVVLDTVDDWRWWIECWQYVLDAAAIDGSDRLLMAFSFGPFIGFWSAHDAVIRRGAMVAPAGGMSTLARIEMMRSIQATAVCCTPSYALHIAEVAAENQSPLAESSVKTIIVAGEPGGSVPDVRARIEKAWDARVVDHAGASEVGAWGFADQKGEGVFVNEAEFIAEFFALESGLPSEDGELSELVLTTLGRSGCPVIRYRTGDLVRPIRDHRRASGFVFLEGGVLGRVDDMMIVRGVNVFPSSVEQILRSFPEVVEFRMTASRDGNLDSLTIEIEDHLNRPERVRNELEIRLGLKVDVKCVPPGSLPRFELKGQRFIDNRRISS
jgi:phenylacetate-CoA ligase